MLNQPRTMRPLPFPAATLRGLSERMIVSHHENNYGGAVKNLNRANAELAQTNKETPPFVVAALQERALTFANSAILHEHYFENLGGDGKSSGAVTSAIGAEYGSFARWEELFRSTALGLAGGSGWVVLCYDFQSGVLRTSGVGHHTQNLAFSRPLLVLDMYEHSYHIDYGAAAAKYVDAFIENVHWEEVNRRFAEALEAARAFGSGK